MRTRLALALFLAACGSKSPTPTNPTGSSGPTANKGVDAPAVSAPGVVAMDESAPPVLVLIDAKGQRSLAAAASWKDVSSGTWSAGPKQAGESASYMTIKEGTMMGRDPKSIVTDFTDFRTGMDDTATRGDGPMDDPPPPEEEDLPDDGEESGGSGTAISLDEGKMGKKDSDRSEGQYKMKKTQDDPQLARQQAIEAARQAGILGQKVDSVPRGLIYSYGRKDAPIRQAQIQGEVTGDKLEGVPAVVIAQPSTKAAAVVKAVAELEAMIGVKRSGQIRPLRIQFHPKRHGPISEPSWLEVRVESSGLTIEAVPSKASTMTWAEASGKLKAAIGEARGKKQWDDKVPVDVLVSDDVDAQHLVDVLVALDGAGVTKVGLGPAPVGAQLTMRGHDPEPAGYGTIGSGSGVGSGRGMGRKPSSAPVVSEGNPNAQGDLDKAVIRRYVRQNIRKIQYCYEKELLAKPNLKGTVQVQFFITPEGKVANATGAGVDPNVASCVADVIKGIEFPKPKGGGGVQVNYPFTFAVGESK